MMGTTALKAESREDTMADEKDIKAETADETAEVVEAAEAAEAVEAVEQGEAKIVALEPVAEDGELAEVEDEDAFDEDDSYDSLTYSNGVIEKIVAMATREVPHVLGMKGNLMHFVQETLGAENLTKGVSVEVTDDNRVIVNISVIIEYGCYAPAIFEDVKERVVERLSAMTGLDIAGINLRIEDVVTREEYEASKKRSTEAAE